MSVDEFLMHAERTGWEVFPPNAATIDVAVESRAPEDLRTFLQHCGGVRCATGIEVAHRVVAAQEVIVGELDNSDRSVDWYILAEESDAATAERVVIDFNPARLGRCYEAFWDRFGIPGSMPVVAQSFSEFLDRLRAADGAPYWSSGSLRLGDAYD